MTEAQYFPITEDELNRIKNDCIHPETDKCPEDCECGGKDDCAFSANILMDEVLSRSPVSSAKSEAVLDELIQEIGGIVLLDGTAIETRKLILDIIKDKRLELLEQER